MAKRKVQDRENINFFTVYPDMADFFTGNRDPIPPWWASCIPYQKLIFIFEKTKNPHL